MNRTILKHIEIASRNGESPFMFESDNKRYDDSQTIKNKCWASNTMGINAC